MVQLFAALHNYRKCQSFGRKGQMTMPASATNTNEIGIVLYPSVQVAPVHGLRICSESPLALHSITSQSIDSRFALRTGNQRTSRDGELSCVFDATRVGEPTTSDWRIWSI
jgi:hypothetical protein